MKGLKLRILLYVAAFLVTAVLTYLFSISDIVYKKDSMSMSSSGLPVVYMISEASQRYNYLYGYVSDVDYAQMHSVVTPVGTDRNMKVGIKSYGTTPTKVTYEIRDLSGQELFEKTETQYEKIDDNNGRIYFKIKNLISSGKEYMLRIKLETDVYGEVSYYSRVILTDNANVDRKLSYVRNFCLNTMDEENIKKIIPKLEPSSKGDNTNLGHVNIHSKLAQVGFGKLTPVLDGEIYPQIDEIDGNVASITLKYNLTTSDDNRKYNYAVKEFYRINQVSEDVTYVYAFDRFMDQKFVPEYSVMSSGNLYLGIKPTDTTQIMTNAAGTVTAFETNGNLWSYHAAKDRLNRVFSFEEDGSDGYRETNQNHKIKIINIDSKGNINYLVYGYMNRGLHEGYTGISAYKYNADSNLSEELVFIPSNEEGLITAEDVEKLIYINEQGILYFYQNQSIYYLNCETKECMLVDKNIIPGNCIMSDNYVVAYQVGYDDRKCTSINVLDLKTGEKQFINCEPSERMRFLGYIDNNLVYGIANYSDFTDKTSFPMKSIRICDEKLNEVRKYEIENMRILDVIFSEEKLVLKRAAYNEDKVLEEINDDQLLSNESNTKKEANIKIIATDDRQKEMCIVPVITSTNNAKLQKSKYLYTSDTSVFINNDFDIKASYYYVFTYGELYYVSNDFEKCKAIAEETGGVVIDVNGDKIWDRYMEKKTS